MTSRLRVLGICLGLALLLVAVSFGALLVGGASAAGTAADGLDVSATAVLGVLRWKLLGGADPPAAFVEAIVWRVRLPEVLLAAAVGAALSISGAVFQTTLRNPLADPLLLGIAGGASLAASVVILLGYEGAMAPALAASLGAGATLVFVFAVAGRKGRFDPATVVLAGVIASTFFSALTLFLFSVSPGQTMSKMLQWTMGSFGDVGFRKVRWAGPVLVALCLASLAGARPLNLLAQGDDAAHSAGLAIGPVRAALYALGAVLTGVSVAAAGVVGFVGLVVPHIARGLFGHDQRVVLPASALAGANLTVLADAVARTAVPLFQRAAASLQGVEARPVPVELPVGAVTALFGAPFFIAILLRGRRRL